MDYTVILAIIVIIVIIILLANYNKFIRLRNKIKNSESGIDVYLNQRFDLIPNLVECVKAYSKHEKELLEKITELRVEYNNNKNIKSASELNGEINKLIAVAENYPELKASEQYLNLQKNLTKMESQLQAARRIYNMDVEKYNNAIQKVPDNIFAKMFGFKEEDFFEIEEYKRENIKIDGDKF